MGKLIKELSKKDIDFIAEQKMFFVATASNESKINLSPKGIDSFRVLNSSEVLWLNLTGSGNETQAHIEQNGRMTIMMCAFEGSPNILRIYGQAKSILPSDQLWTKYIKLFPTLSGSRQLFLLSIDAIQNSCGFGVPFFEYTGERNTLLEWANKKGEQGIKAYQKSKNTVSIDGEKIKNI